MWSCRLARMCSGWHCRCTTAIHYWTQASSATVVPKGCTNIWDVPSINVLGVVYHGHLVGKSFNIDVASSVDGSYRGTLRREKRYDFNHQSLEPRLLKTISRRDELTFTCKYDTSSRTELTAFGELTQNGTCWSAFTYYPAQAMTSTMTKGASHIYVESIVRLICRPGEGGATRDWATDCVRNTCRVARPNNATVMPGVTFGTDDEIQNCAQKVCDKV
ncbi:unnamed protein product [Prorocentrum cordatum]|uniref:Copper type II ascorbate-dependent monooxygenase C-terminal domain-containing protein n=2 Tax=Prorocentrum cordatum TaxID=2364126 RepID=A0ABN9S4D2_9DINO|nr:unnamed protein product [Polarella glacialis]